MLTGVQLMAIETQSVSPPWNMRDLFRKFPARTLSVRSIIGAVENQKIGCFVRLRYPSILQSATSFGALQASFVAGHGGLLDRRRLLVHRIDVVRESCHHDRTLLDQLLFWYSP